MEGIAYAPVDAAFDDVGLAQLDGEGGADISVSHHTLPIPSYVEVTALDTGRTILARVERRGPMSGRAMVGLSPTAFAQLGADTTAPLAVRVRRVNPQEYERALLRTGQRAPERLATPNSLLEVLRKLLAAKAQPAAAPQPMLVEAVPQRATERPALAPAKPPVTVAGKTKAAATAKVTSTLPAKQTSPAKPLTASPDRVAAQARGLFEVQVAAFANRANAEATARKLGGTVAPAGKLSRVRLGPFETRAAADAARAKARAAGFADASIVTSAK